MCHSHLLHCIFKKLDLCYIFDVGVYRYLTADAQVSSASRITSARAHGDSDGLISQSFAGARLSSLSVADRSRLHEQAATRPTR